MKHRDTNPDEAIDLAIDRVLTGLREAEPLGGMQQRVIRAARERASTRPRWSLQLTHTARHFWAVAVATVTVIVLAASWKTATIVRSHRNAREIAHVLANRSPTNQPAEETHLKTARIAHPQPLHEARLPSNAEHIASVELVSDEDALAISEMLAPSKPAPPLPLTHQEVLLAQVVHHGDSEEVAELKPEERAKEIEIAKSEFHDFFEPPLPAKKSE